MSTVLLAGQAGRDLGTLSSPNPRGTELRVLLTRLESGPSCYWMAHVYSRGSGGQEPLHLVAPWLNLQGPSGRAKFLSFFGADQQQESRCLAPSFPGSR